ncbi:hypothetical protein BC629DRAFT_1587483 [Irpex lacteus]|nr:hypothetical protein BC629DRAFT_1587483 [Irpex lacteus]
MTLAMLSRPALPADFKSVYRLFLRASASATLHSGRGTRTLRQHWRPVFEEAAIKLCKLYDPSCQEEHPQLRGWMHDWDRKIDNTLSLLYNSSHNRGLANRLTRNLSLLHVNVNRTPTAHWKPNGPPDDPRYQVPEPAKSEKPKAAVQRRRDDLEKQTWNALGEVIRMAENTNEVSLGRIVKNLR